MDPLRFRCNLRFLILLVFVIILLIAYKIIIVQRYITTYNELAPHNPHSAVDNEIQPNENTNIFSFNGEQIIHLDLKGAPPSLNYFQRLFPLLNSLNVTGLLVEYEDVFPYSSKFTHAVNTYLDHDIKHFLKLAKKYKLMVIPLVQTFGHLEFALKIKKFSHLREVLRYPQAVCPSHEETFQFITGMLDEVIALHADIRYIHIGCDEVYQLGVCPRCTARMSENRWTSKDLFLNHVTKIAKYIRSTYPHITPLMWDDELRDISLKTLKESEIGRLVEPVIWRYQPSITFSFSMWETYSKVFSGVWIASSFKGATGVDQILPQIDYHVANHKSWLRIVAQYSYMITFKGIVLTGWQRYDHFAVLCELLPVSIPSMINSLLVLRGSSFGIMEHSKKVKDVVACGRLYKYSELCQFPGVNLYNAVVAFTKLRKEIDQVLDSSLIKGWLTEYNLQQGYFNPLLTEELSYKVHDCQLSLNRSKETLQTELRQIYDSYTVTEWIQTYVHPYTTKLNGISGILHYVKNIKEWPPRSIGVINEKKRNS